MSDVYPSLQVLYNLGWAQSQEETRRDFGGGGGMAERVCVVAGVVIGVVACIWCAASGGCRKDPAGPRIVEKRYSWSHELRDELHIED